MFTAPWGVELVLVTVVLFAFLFMGVPIAVSLGLTGFLMLSLFAGVNLALNSFTILLYTTPVNFVLLCVPLFILLAEIANFSGVVNKVFDAMQTLFGGFRSGLLMAVVGVGTVFAAINGSSVASCAAMGPLSLGQMIKRGIDKADAAGVIAAAGGLAIVIPPSTVFVLYGFVADTSVAKLFLAGIFPGLLLALGYLLTIVIKARFRPPQVSAAPAAYPLKTRILGLVAVWPFAVLFLLMMGSMYLGIATPTEAAALGVAGAFTICLGEGRLSWSKLSQALVTTMRVTGFVFMIIIGAFTFGFLMTYMRLPIRLAEFTASSGLAPLGILIAVNVVFLFLGCVLDGAALVLIMVPIFLPALKAVGYDMVWIGVILCINIEMGLITPPVGMNLFVLQGVGRPFGITFWDVVRGSAPYLLCEALVIALVIMFPQIALWLPNQMTR